MTGLNLTIDEREAQKLLDQITNELFAKSQEEIVRLGIIDEGFLLKSGNIRFGNLVNTIVYPVPYAQSINFGRAVGKHPPVQPLIGWVKRKLGVQDDKLATKIAWRIAKKLEKQGTLPRPFLDNAIVHIQNKHGN